MRDKIRPPAACGRNLLIMPENRLSHATYDTLCAGRRQFVSTQAVSSTVRSSRPTPTIPLSNGLPPSDRCLFCRMLISEHSSWLILRQGSDAIMFRKATPVVFIEKLDTMPTIIGGNPADAPHGRSVPARNRPAPGSCRRKRFASCQRSTICPRTLLHPAHGCAGEQALDSVSLNSDRDLKLGILSHGPIRGEWLCDNKLSFYSNCGR